MLTAGLPSLSDANREISTRAVTLGRQFFTCGGQDRPDNRRHRELHDASRPTNVCAQLGHGRVLIAYLWSKGEGSPKQIVDRMMTEAGLAGISGIGFDMRDLLAAAERGHERARLAVDTYVYQIRKYLGSFLLVLGHTDVITFAAGTGETSPEIREQILRDTEELGIRLDPDRNAKCIRREGLISSDDSRIKFGSCRRTRKS